MPLYEYTCSSCQNKFEILARSFSDAAPPCPKCGAHGTERRMSAFAVGTSGPSLPQRPADCSQCEGGPCAGGACGWNGDDF